MEGYIKIIIICSVSIGLGIVLGNGAVYLFNKIPGRWLCDYGQEPSEELLHPTKQRIRSTPWKYVFTVFFILAGITMGIKDAAYAMGALMAIWLLLEMSIADIKYMIVPDQFIMLLVLTGIGLVPSSGGNIKSSIWGAAVGLVLIGSMAILGRLIYKKWTVGGADIKLFTVLGLVLGLDGLIFTFVVTTFLSAGHFVFLLIKKKAKLTDERPVVPYIFIAATLYMVFFREIMYNDFILVF